MSASPWYLMLGPESTGKTTLLSRSDLKFIVEKKLDSQNKIPKTNQCNFWATKNAVIVEAAGDYFNTEDVNSFEAWQAFLKNLKKHSHRALNGIVFTFSVDQLISPNTKKQNKLFDNIREHLNKLSKHFSSQIPIYIIINKFDLITGFNEFFDDLSRDERWQIWGVPLDVPQPAKTKQINNTFDAEFDKLFERLNEQVIWRLQHEVNIDKRALINGFPLQIAQLKPHLTSLLNNICAKQKNKSCIKGIFFTSTDKKIQQHSENKMPQIGANNLTSIVPTSPKQAYFVHDLFEKNIFKNGLQVDRKSRFNFLKHLFRWAFFTGVLAVIIGLTMTWVSSFKQQIETINTANQSIIAYEVMANMDTNQKYSLPLQLKSLNSLLHAVHSFQHQQPNALKMFFSREVSKTLHQKTFTAYQKALNTSFYKAVVKNMAGVIADQSTKPALLFRTLKSYLMLGNPDKFDPDYIKNTMRIIWSHQYAPDVQAQLLNYLSVLLNNHPKSIVLDTSLVDFARNKLNKLSHTQLAFTLLKSNISDDQLLSLDLNTNKTAAAVITLIDDNISIPSIYTAKNFSIIYPTLLKQTAIDTLKGSWVLGNKNNDQSVSTKKIDDFTEKLTTQYLSNYTAIWVKFLYNIKIVNFTDMTQLDNALSLLSADNSPLIQLITLIHNNLTDPVINSNAALASLKIISSDNNNASLQYIQQTLSQLNAYISSITTAQKPYKKNFELTAYRMRNFGHDDPITKLFELAERYPEPLKNWLYNIAMNTWELMLFQSQLTINQAWQKNIVPQYNAQIENRYPFTLVASNNVSLESFSYFFAPNGLLNTFFKNYLSAFVDTTKQPWQLKKLDAASPQIPDSTLQAFQTAFEIQHLYFNAVNEKLQIPFILTAKNISPNISNVKFKLGSQVYAYYSNKPVLRSTLLWPDQSNQNLAFISLTDKFGTSKKLVEHGPWAWLKLMQKVSLKTDNNKHQYKIIFDKSEYPAEFSVIFKSQKNPFSLQHFSSFQLPREI